MKKRKFLFCTILSLILLCANLPIASAALTTVEATYDNSVKISLRSPYETFQETEAYLPYYGEEGIDYRLVEKKSFSTEFQYEFLAVTEPDLLENLKAKFSKPGIGSSPNIYAKDYNERTSVLTLSANTLEIPVGETATIQIDKCELLTSVFNEEGVVVELDPQVISYEEFQQFVQEQFQQGGNYLATYTLYEEDYHYQNDKYENGHLMFENYIERAFANQDQVQREKVQSPINRYAVAFAFANFEQTVEPLANLEGVLSVEPFYTHALTGMPPHEKWTVENEEIASITAQTENPYGLNSVVTVTANKVGKTEITLCRGGGSVSLFRTCTVTVVEPEPDTNTNLPDLPVTDTNVTPTQIPYGDVNDDGLVDAKDALIVLQISAKKFKGNAVANLAVRADVTGDQRIDAKDALDILKYSVKKITKFKVQS